MPNITLYAQPPDGYNLPALRQQMADAHGARDVNEINDGEYLAVYFRGDAPITEADWQAILDAHDPAALTDAQQAAQQRQFDRQDLDSAIQAGLDAIDTHEAALTDSPTSAEVVAAVLFLLRAFRRLLRFIRWVT